MKRFETHSLDVKRVARRRRKNLRGTRRKKRLVLRNTRNRIDWVPSEGRAGFNPWPLFFTRIDILRGAQSNRRLVLRMSLINTGNQLLNPPARESASRAR